MFANVITLTRFISKNLPYCSLNAHIDVVDLLLELSLNRKITLLKLAVGSTISGAVCTGCI